MPTCRRSVALAAAGLAAVALTGCNGNNNAAAGASPGTLPPSPQNSLPADQQGKFPVETIDTIRSTMQSVLSGTVADNWRAIHIQDGNTFAHWLQDHPDLFHGVRATISDVHVDTLRHATFTATLTRNGSTVTSGFHGDAFNAGPEWRMSNGSFCRVVDLLGASPPNYCPVTASSSASSASAASSAAASAGASS